MNYQKAADEYLSTAAVQIFEALGELIGDTIHQTEAPDLLTHETSAQTGVPTAEAPTVALRVSTTTGEGEHDTSSDMLLLMEFEDARRLAQVLGVGDQTGPVKESALTEFTNIVAGQFASVLFELTGCVVRVSVPEVHMDMFGSIVETFMALAEDTKLSVVGFRAASADAWGFLVWLPNEKLVEELFEELEAEAP